MKRRKPKRTNTNFVNKKRKFNEKLVQNHKKKNDNNNKTRTDWHKNIQRRRRRRKNINPCVFPVFHTIWLVQPNDY